MDDGLRCEVSVGCSSINWPLAVRTMASEMRVRRVGR